MTRQSVTIREFWQRASRLPRAALACAGLSAVLNLASHARAPLPGRLRWAAAASLVYTVARFGWLGSTYPEGAPQVRDGVEVWLAADSSVTVLAPGATATYDARILRPFSAAWMFFALTAALVSHAVAARIRAYRADGRGVAGQGASPVAPLMVLHAHDHPRGT